MVNIVNLIGLKSADQVSKGSTLDVYMRAFPQRTKAGNLSLNVVGSAIPAWEPEGKGAGQGGKPTVLTPPLRSLLSFLPYSPLLLLATMT